jgi:hypothetical protein
MVYFMKIGISIYFISLLISCQSSGQKIQRKDAAYAINLIDSLTTTLGDPANKLVAYSKSLSTEMSLDNKVEKTLVDTMQIYYNALISSYEKAIEEITNNETLAKFKEMQSNFLVLLNKGKEPWVVTVPVQIKMYREGWDSLSIAEQEIFKTKESFMMKSASVVLEWAKIVAVQEDELEKKYHLELINDKYR